MHEKTSSKMNFWFQITKSNCYTEFGFKGSMIYLKSKQKDGGFPYGTG